MNRNASWLVVSLAICVLTACAHSTTRPGATARTTIGTVERAERVTLDSNAGTGALVGGTLGLMASRGESTQRQARNAIIGGVAGAGIASAAQGSRDGWRYTVRTTAGQTISIVSDQGQIHVGDCVVVEESGNTANIRRASPVLCQRESAPAAAQVSQVLQTHANECAAAKQQLVEATSAEQVDLATRKVQILCDD
ncbi:MAG TPA: hypothetical protein VKE42_09590 [Candidatus Cybelea sp.]|nr:hypothetical protein [Candidatus Cybelea sp.]